ncbi:4Fe-4S binding protein [bacterium]|nr:4Fe-4S binding protein [bacterium]
MRKIQTIRGITEGIFLGVTVLLMVFFLKPYAAVHSICPFSLVNLLLINISTRFEAGVFFPTGVTIGATAVLSSLVIPRFFCGWICPIGTVERLLFAAGKKLGISCRLPGNFSYVYFFAPLLVLLTVSFLSIKSGVICCQSICPLFYHTKLLGTVSIVLLVLFVAGSLVIERFFCKFVCPFGVILGVFGLFSIFTLRSTCFDKPCLEQNCTLASVCPGEIDLYRANVIRSVNCYGCLKCTRGCPLGRNFKLGIRYAKKDSGDR